MPVSKHFDQPPFSQMLADHVLGKLHQPKAFKAHFDVEPLGSFALTADEDVLLMGLASCLGYYSLSTGRFSKITVTPGVSGPRINDGRCDRMGNFIFSTMDAAEQVQTIGRFHRLNAVTLETETLDLSAVAIPNSICFSLDGSTLYYADSLQGCIYCCD